MNSFSACFRNLLILCIFTVKLIATSPKIAFWGTWNIPCGIAMYTKHLKDAFEKRGYIVKNYDHTADPLKIPSVAKKDHIEILNIQYDLSIMPKTPLLLKIIDALQKNKIKVIVTLHYEPSDIQKIASKANLIIYHKQPVYLKKNKKMIILPMGVPVFNPSMAHAEVRKKYGFSRDDLILVSTGFLLSSKQPDVILQLLTPYLKKNSNLKIQLLHSFTPRLAHICAQEYEKLIKVIQENNLQRQVTLLTNFLSQQELNERLWISDLGYQWLSAQNTPGTSATAKEYISSRTPLIVPYSSHFHDINTGTVKTPFDHTQFVKIIMDSLTNKQLLETLKNQLEEEYKKLNYNNLIDLYIQAFTKL